jgi:hypothetical protein
MDEYVFWTIYFTLCKRYLPVHRHEEQPQLQQPLQHQQQQEAVARSSSSTSSSQQAAAGAAGGTALPLSSSAANLLQETEVSLAAAALISADALLEQTSQQLACKIGITSLDT